MFDFVYVCSTLDIFLFRDKWILETEIVDVWWKFEDQFFVDPIPHDSVLMDFNDTSRAGIHMFEFGKKNWNFISELLKLSGLFI